MSRNDVLERNETSLESKIEYITASAESWQEVYEECLEDPSDQDDDDLEELIEGYAVMMGQVHVTYNIMASTGKEEYAELMLDTFEDVSETQQEYATEARELAEHTPLELFKKEYGLETEI